MGNKIKQLMSQELKDNLNYDISKTQFQIENEGWVREMKAKNNSEVVDKDKELDDYFQGQLNRAKYVITLLIVFMVISVGATIIAYDSLYIRVGVLFIVSMVMLVGVVLVTPMEDLEIRQRWSYMIEEYNNTIDKINNLNAELLYDVETGEITNKYCLIDWEKSTGDTLSYQSKKVIELKDIKQKTINKELEIYIQDILENKERYVTKDTKVDIGDKYLGLLK